MDNYRQDIFFETSNLSLKQKKAICNEAFNVKDSFWVYILEDWTKKKIEMPFEDIMKKLDLTCHFNIIDRYDLIEKDNRYGEVVFSIILV